MATISQPVMAPVEANCTIGRRFRARDTRALEYGLMPRGRTTATDAFTNAAARMGWGTPNLSESADYTMVRTSFDYWLLITLYRNHWISRRIVDTPAQDMVRAWPKINTDLAPEDLTRVDRALRHTRTKSQILTSLKWARLFGGAGALIVIEGQENELSEPLKLDNIEPGAYRGLIPFDRWTGISPLGDVETDISRPNDFNLPKYYQVTQPGAETFRVHASRILRFTGPSVPTPEYQAQSWWGISALEPAYEEIRKRDNMSWNILSLTFRASLIGMRSKDLAQMLSGAGMNTQALQGFYSRMEAMNHLMSNQSMLVLPEEGGLESINYTFSGVSDVYQQFQLDIAGAANLPASRLFGRTITGLGQSNDADERLYEERIALDQEESLRPQLEKLYPVICMSELGEVPDDLEMAFPSVRVLTEEEKLKLATDTTANVTALVNAGLLSKPQGLKEIKQSSDITGFGTNITDEDIEAAEREEEQGLGGLGEEMPDETSALPREKQAPEEPGEKQIDPEEPPGSIHQRATLTEE
jgi:phage-related protein (TIGR01555 family)